MKHNFLMTFFAIALLTTAYSAYSKELIAVSPEEIVRQAVVHVDEQRYQKALDLLKALPEELTAQAELLYLRSSAHAGLGDLAATRADLDSAVTAKPDYLPARFALARLALASGDLDSARVNKDALKEKITDSNDAQLQALERDLAAAEKALEAGEQLAPMQLENSDDVIAAASLLWREDDTDAAINLLKAWITGRPDDLRVRIALAGVYDMLDRKSDALNTYESVIERDSRHAAALNNAAWLLREDYPSKAFDYARVAVEQEPENPALLDTYAVIAHVSGNKTEALKASRLASDLAPGVPAILLNAAKIEMDIGDETRARAYLEQITAKKEDLAEKSEAQALLRSLD